MKQRLAVAVALVLTLLALAGPAATRGAAPAPFTEQAVAVWTLTDGCVETTISVAGDQARTAAGDPAAPPTAFIHLSQHEFCTNPLIATPVRTVWGATQAGVALELRGDLRAGRLTATVPLTCAEYTACSCAAAPFSAGTVSLVLTWASSGELVQYPWGGYRCGQATGSIRLGDANLLQLGGGGVARSDPTETNLGRTFID